MGHYSHISLSPDESEVAFTRYGEGATSIYLSGTLIEIHWGVELLMGLLQADMDARWTQLIYSDSTEGLRIIASNGTDQPSTIFSSSSNATPTSISPDGKLIFDMGNPRKLYMLDLFSQENKQ